MILQHNEQQLSAFCWFYWLGNIFSPDLLTICFACSLQFIMAGGAISADINKIPKPVLRGLHNATIRNNLIVSSVLMSIAGVAYYFHNQGRIHDYAEFYKWVR